jgi:hypothetical protein
MECWSNGVLHRSTLPQSGGPQAHLNHITSTLHYSTPASGLPQVQTRDRSPERLRRRFRPEVNRASQSNIITWQVSFSELGE